MKKKFVFLLLIVILLLASLAAADDGAMFRRNVSRTPDMETEDAQLSMMYLYVLAQGADGIVEPIEYYLDTDGDNQGDTLWDTREYAKPLIASYIDAIGHEDEEASAGPMRLSGATFGAYDTFGAVSLDDGASWKEFNVSRAADRSSFRLADGHAYPGSSGSAVHAVAGDRVMVAWTSKYCAEGKPNYTLTEDEILALQTAYPDLDTLYFDLIEDGELVDLFGVMGTQQSVDYTLQGFPEVGEIPYSCVWTARGSLEELDDGTYDVIWYKAERLTSGRRDANRVEIDAVPGVGFAIMWQEDPEGLRPGQGLGPGEGWSGAIVNSKTDIWYSYVPWGVFELVDDDDDVTTAAIPIEQYAINGDEPMPKPAVPMAMPVRLTDNDMCKEGSLSQPENPYCFYEFDTGTYHDEQDAASDLCAEIVEWTNPGGTTLRVCQTDDGRVLTGRIGASRPRFNMWPRDTDNDGVPESAWVVMAYEESKALGATVDEETLDPIDIGKNIWYHSFDMLTPDLVAQGGMLNQPAMDPETGEFFDPLIDEDWGYEFYETEIGRRFSLVSQPLENVYDADLDTILGSGTSAFLVYKQGIINQGGPADIFARRVVLPDTFDPEVDNPYAFEYIECDTWAYADGTNPYYLQGICLDPAINISGTNIDECDNGSSGTDCADAFPWDPQEDLGDNETFPKVTRWSQDVDNLDDQSWENPYDVAKGHRGFIDGDFVMVIYAWSPNWQANSVGNDHYNLYVRRSFDGGQTWTTTPAGLGGTGTTTCEYYYLGTVGEVEEVCTSYAAGEFEQARNVSKLTGNRETILDPRYTPTGGLNLVNEVKCYTGTADADAWGTCAGDLPYWDDLLRDPSKYFIVFETGDNTTVAEGEAVPLDLFYSRGTVYGDFYDEVEYLGQGNEPYYYWDWLEKDEDDLSGEAALTTNLGGDFLYAIWNQWNEYEEEVITNSDAWFRRLLYNDTTDAEPTATILYVSHTTASTSAGDTLTFIGTAEDNDHLGAGIVAYEWQSDLKGILSAEKYFTITAADLGLGLHYITFRAQDDEGNWSAPAQIRVRVVDKYLIFLPQVND